MINGISYEEIKPHYIDEQTAIMIASHDRNLKDYIFTKTKRNPMIIPIIMEI